MNSGAVFGILLTLRLFVFNYFPYTLRERYKLPYWVSGIIICCFGPLVAMGVGSYWEAQREGSDGFGAGLAGAIIALVLIANGALYIIGSMVSGIERFVARQKKDKTHSYRFRKDYCADKEEGNMKVYISNLLLGLLFGLIVGSSYDQQGICIMLGGILGVGISIYLQLHRIQRYLSERTNHTDIIQE